MESEHFDRRQLNFGRRRPAYTEADVPARARTAVAVSAIASAFQGNPVIVSARKFQDSFEITHSSHARFLSGAPDAGRRGGQLDMRYPEFTQPVHDGVGYHPQSRRDATFPASPQAERI